MSRCAAPGKAHPARRGYLCDRHLARLGEYLADVQAEAGAVDAAPSLAVSYEPGGGAPAFEQVPVRLDAVALTDTRHGLGLHELPDDRHAAGSVPAALAVLRRWADVVRTRRHLAPPRRRTLAGERLFLATHLAWCAEQAWAGELYRAVRELRAALQAVNGTSDDRPLPGRCPWLVADAECGGPLWPARPQHTTGEFAATGPDAVVCGDDREHRWEGRDLARLALIVEQQRRGGGS